MTSSPASAYKSKLQAWKAEIQQKTGKTTEQLYEEREKRIRDCLYLKEPDRIPLWLIAENNPRLGLPPAAAYYNPLAWKEALVKEILRFEPDMHMGIIGNSGAAWEALGVKNRLWPGGPLPEDYEYQFIEVEFMKADEYEIFLSDPSDFVVRYYLPRMYGALEPLAKLPPVGQMYGSFEYLVTMFDSPEFKKMAAALAKAGRELKKFRKTVGNIQEDMAGLGFPDMGQGFGVGVVPFDTVSSSFRGMKGSMLDMYRQPEKLLKLCDTILDKRIAAAAPPDPKARGNPKRAGIPLWRGDCNFMSEEQFNRFYWPGLKRVLQADIDLGYMPIPLIEAKFGKRLERFLELPKGKVAIVVENVDIIPAREILGGHTCVIGKPPVSLQYANIPETLDYYRDIIKKCRKGGGLMLRLILPQKASVEDLQAMNQTIREWCRY